MNTYELQKEIDLLSARTKYLEAENKQLIPTSLLVWSATIATVSLICAAVLANNDKAYAPFIAYVPMCLIAIRVACIRRKPCSDEKE